MSKFYKQFMDPNLSKKGFMRGFRQRRLDNWIKVNKLVPFVQNKAVQSPQAISLSDSAARLLEKMIESLKEKRGGLSSKARWKNSFYLDNKASKEVEALEAMLNGQMKKLGGEEDFKARLDKWVVEGPARTVLTNYRQATEEELKSAQKAIQDMKTLERLSNDQLNLLEENLAKEKEAADQRRGIKAPKENEATVIKQAEPGSEKDPGASGGNVQADSNHGIGLNRGSEDEFVHENRARSGITSSLRSSSPNTVSTINADGLGNLEHSNPFHTNPDHSTVGTGNHNGWATFDDGNWA